MAGRGRLWDVGTWREARQIDGAHTFAPDGRIVAVLDPDRVIRLVDFATERTLARLESPDLCGVHVLAFSPDGSRLVLVTNDGPAAHVWDLRAIRKQLADRGLDWDAPAYPEADPADPSAPPLPAAQVDYGPLAGHLEHFSEAPEALVRRHTERLRADSRDAEAYHHRAHAMRDLRRILEAIDDLTRAIELRPDDAHLRSLRGAIALDLKRYEPAIADLETALALNPDQPSVRERLALCCNNRAWELSKGPGQRRTLALTLARRAVELAPGEAFYANTLGVAQYRADQYAEAITTLETSLAARQGGVDAFDLFFLAMARFKLGQIAQARADFDRALKWRRDHPILADPGWSGELDAFQAEARALLDGRSGELPADVFAPE
jgi:tetratricopeptide (TPR) repeat protein